MRKFHILITALFVLCVLTFISSFVYVDKQRHSVYHFVIDTDGREVGVTRIDRYATENALLYKSTSALPRDAEISTIRSKIMLSRQYRLESYSRESTKGVTDELFYAEAGEGALSYVSISHGLYTAVHGIPINSEEFIFEEGSPITYLPLIENYDFRRGRSQGFNAVTRFAPLLPPLQRVVTFTSIRDEYIVIDGRRLKAECLVLKIKNYPQGIVWVSKADRSVVAIELPDKRIKFKRIWSAKKIEAVEYLPEDSDVIEKPVEIISKTITLTGTLAEPSRGGSRASILLIGGDDPEGRSLAGLFQTLAGKLAKRGYAVLRYDRRGTGMSGGDDNVTTLSDHTLDALSAIDLLRARSSDPNVPIFIIAHGDGAAVAAAAASVSRDIQALALMSPATPASSLFSQNAESLRIDAKLNRWPDSYLALVTKAYEASLKKTALTSDPWTIELGKRVPLVRLRAESANRTMTPFSTIDLPLLILRGAAADPATTSPAAAFEELYSANANRTPTLIYLSYLDRMLGKRVAAGNVRTYYDVDQKIVDSIDEWLKKVMVPTSPQLGSTENIVQ